jgi:hypothetical protein
MQTEALFCSDIPLWEAASIPVPSDPFLGAAL